MIRKNTAPFFIRFCLTSNVSFYIIVAMFNLEMLWQRRC